MPRKRITQTILFFLLITVFSSGCAKQSPEPKLTSVTIAFQQFVGYGPFYLAKDKGFDKEEGIDLVIIDDQLDSGRRDAFKQGMLDCEAGTIDLLVSKAAQNTPIVAVLKLDQSFGADAIVAAGSIKSLKDLVGRTISLAKDDVGETFILALFSKIGLSFDGVNVVSVNPEEIAQAFLNGDSDACVTWEPQVSKALNRVGSHILTRGGNKHKLVAQGWNHMKR